MRRLVVSVLVGFGLVVIGSGAASAEPVPGASAAQAVAGKKMCKVTDERLDELSGIVATDDGFVVINDGSPLDSHKRVFFLDAKCKVVDDVAFSGAGPLDTEDLILSPDGKTLWIADIGDNEKNRRTIGLWSMPADGSKKPKLHRLAYPAEGKHDAEALLLNGDGTPIIVTKEVGKAAALYTPTAALKVDNTEGVPLKKVGDVTVPPSDTSANTLARLLRGSIDGGAVAQGGSKVVLRTYTDALEWDVTGGDVLGALKGAPRVTPLPDEQLGEAITYSPDGKYFYTVSDMQGKPEDAENFILRYTPAPKVTTNKAAAGGGAGGDSGTSWFDDLSINDITYLVGAVGVLGAILVGVGIFGIMRARKRPPLEPAGKGAGSGGLDPTDPETELLTVGGAAAASGGSGVYGGDRAGGPGVYGAKPVPPGKGSGVYGGGRSGPGGQPARPGVGQPGHPGQGGRPARPGPAGVPARPGPAGQPARPGPAGQPVRPGPAGVPARPGPAGVPARPGPAGVPARPGPAGQPARPGQGGVPARPGQGGQPVRRPGGGQPQPTGRPPQGGQPAGRPPQGGQPAGRPPQGGQPTGRPPQGGQPGGGRPGQGGGVYGAPPPPPPQGPQRGGSGKRPSGFFGQGSGHPDDGRQASNDMNNYADSRGRGRDYDNPGYGRR